ncbi:MAG: hypothetical protein R3202_01735, partial [Candidatus Competibacterales bacterium]|nr:hypothetical protein [Candidatus Competibacterales bacterium]
MRIASIEAFPVRPRTLKEGYAEDGPWPARFPVFLVRVTTEDGRVGTGEATSQVWYLGETGAQIRAALRLSDDARRGTDPAAIGVCHQRMEAVYAGGMPGARAARCGVDLALH